MVYFLIIIAIILIDQTTKHYINKNYKPDKFVNIYKNKLYFTNVKNNGAIFGFLKTKPIILMILTCSTMLYLIVILIKAPSKFLKIGLSFAIGGGIGNLIDRIFKKEVTDFIYIKSKNNKSPVFNIADLCIFISAIVLLFFTVSDKK